MAKPSKQKQQNKPKLQSNSWWLWLVPVLLAGIVLSGTLKNGFTNLDDDFYIVNNPYIKELSWESTKAIFSDFYLANYHPLTTFTYALEYSKFGLDPKPYHLVNLLLHLANVFLVFVLIKQLTKRQDAALIVAAIFGIHPMHVESVAWISERKDVLYTMFYLGALINYLKYIQRGFPVKYLVFCVFLFVGSLFSKSAAVTLPLVLVLFDYYEGRSIKLKTLLEKTPLFALSVLFGILALKSQGTEQSIGDISVTYNTLEHFLIVCYTSMYYIVKLLLPLQLSAMHYYPQDGLTTLYYLAPLGIALIAFTVYKFKEIRKELIFGLLFFFITIFLVLQIIPVGSAMVAERYTYLPYVGLALIIAHIYMRAKAKRIMASILVLAVISFSFISWSRVKVWENGITLFSDVIEKYPVVFHGYLMRGSARNETGDYKGGFTDLSKAIELNPGIARTYNNRGIARRNLQDYHGAIEDYSQAIILEPNYDQAYNNRGNAKAMLQDYKGAINDFNMVEKLNTSNIVAINNRGNAKLMLQDFEGAIRDYDITIDHIPDHAPAYYNRAVARFNAQGLNDQACMDWQVAAQLGHPKAAVQLQANCNNQR